LHRKAKLASRSCDSGMYSDISDRKARDVSIYATWNCDLMSCTLIVTTSADQSPTRPHHGQPCHDVRRSSEGHGPSCVQRVGELMSRRQHTTSCERRTSGHIA
jgi:hypothetical protein